MKYFSAIILSFLLVFAGHAQPYYFRHYEVENGLSNNTVFCSVQDKNGFMWFGTKDGLNRFDGYQFKIFHITNRDTGSLSRDLISSLVIDNNGTLWIGSQKGLFRFDQQNERLVPFLDSIRDINNLLIDRSGQLWITSGLTLCRYNFNNKQFTLFPTGKYFETTSFTETEHGEMWFSSTNGFIHRYEPATNTFTKFNVFEKSPPAATNWVYRILANKKGYIYIGTSAQGIKQFNLATFTYKDILTYNADKTTIYVRDIARTSDDEIWFATESGIFILNQWTGKFQNLKKKFLDPYTLSDNAIYTIYQDGEGGIWAGTYFGGLNYFPKQYFSFQKFFPDYSKNSISGSAVREICEDHEGNIWIATEDAGISKLNPWTKEIQHFSPDGTPTGISNSNIHGLLVIGNDLWIGTFEHGLDIMDIRTGKVKKHYKAGPGPHDLKSNFILNMLQTKSGAIYLATSNGVFRYDPATDGFARDPGLPVNGFFSSLLEDNEGNIWMSSHGSGIFYYNPITGATGNLTYQPNNRNSLPTDVVNALYLDSRNRIWCATEGGGLAQLSQDKKQFRRFSTKEGFSSNFIYKILEDSEKKLWVTTSKGLVNMDLDGKNKIVYTKTNGLLNDQFNYNSGYRGKDGRLYFGSVRGMITFNPANFYQSKFVAPVFITGFQVHNKELEIGDNSHLKNSIIHTNKITLPHDQSSFSIDFAAVSFTYPERTEYKYKMEGMDKEWTYLTSNRKVYFTNIKPGEYVFKLQAAGTGFKGTHERDLIIKILPPFWATNLAYVIYTILGLLLLYYIVRTYHNVHENKKAKEIYEAKIDFFTNIAHEIKTPLTLIKGPVDNLSEMVNEVPAIQEDVAMMQRNTSRLVNLVNQILDFRRTEAKGFSLDFTPVNLNENIKEAFITFEPVAKKKGLDYSIHLPNDNIFTLADDEALNKIFSNLFSNAVKYAEKKVSVVLVTPQKEDKVLVLAIRNDGNLIPDDMREKIFEPFVRLKENNKQKGTGIGLALARSLVELHGGKLYLEKPENGMNVFIMTIPWLTVTDKKKTVQEMNQAPNYL